MKRIALFLALAMLLTVLTLGCGQQVVKDEPNVTGEEVQKEQTVEEKLELEPLSPVVKVTVGMKEVVSDGGVLIGMAKGYYKELGIEIESVAFNTGQDMINAREPVS